MLVATKWVELQEARARREEKGQERMVYLVAVAMMCMLMGVRARERRELRCIRVGSSDPVFWPSRN